MKTTIFAKRIKSHDGKSFTIFVTNWDDLDYSKTVLTDKEIGYCINDIKVVMAYLQECIDTEGAITKIPLTKTGYIRRYVRNACFGYDLPEKNFKRWDYMQLMQSLTLEPEEYQMLTITITEQDFNIIKNVYTWTYIRVGNMVINYYNINYNEKENN